MTETTKRKLKYMEFEVGNIDSNCPCHVLPLRRYVGIGAGCLLEMGSYLKPEALEGELLDRLQ